MTQIMDIVVHLYFRFTGLILVNMVIIVDIKIWFIGMDDGKEELNVEDHTNESNSGFDEYRTGIGNILLDAQHAYGQFADKIIQSPHDLQLLLSSLRLNNELTPKRYQLIWLQWAEHRERFGIKAASSV